MREFLVLLKDGTTVIIKSQKVVFNKDQSIVFLTNRKSISEQYIQGSEINALFKSVEYLYFKEL